MCSPLRRQQTKEDPSHTPIARIVYLAGAITLTLVLAANHKNIAISTALVSTALAMFLCWHFHRRPSPPELEEHTKNTIAAELHDTAAQTLLAAKWELSTPAPDLKVLGDLIHETEQQIRAVLADNHTPAVTEPLNVFDDLFTSLNHRYGLQIQKAEWPTTPPQPPFRPRTTLTLYRFFQETLQNVHKHAHTPKATVTLRYTRFHVHATVSDKGKGFSTRKPTTGGYHIGLTTLESRAKNLGGKVKINSTPGAGTTIKLTMVR